MSTTVPVNDNPGGMPRWLLPLALALLVALIVAAGYFATHRNLVSARATATPTATPTAKVRQVVVTSTPTPVGRATAARAAGGGAATPTPTAIAGATSAPSATPTPAPSPTPTAPGGVHLGAVPHPRPQLLQIQQGANRNESRYTLNLDPFRVVRASLPSYGFKTVTIQAPTPQPTPTSFSGSNGLPTVEITVQYVGHTFVVVLQQPVQQGPKGIWVVTAIRLKG